MSLRLTQLKIAFNCINLPASNAGDAMGDSSTLRNSCPSVGRLGLGSTTSHDTCPNTLNTQLINYVTYPVLTTAIRERFE